MTDAELLLKLAADPRLHEKLIVDARAAYLAARGLSDAHWEALDARWADLERERQRGRVLVENGTTNPWSQAWNAAQVRMLRAELDAAEHYRAVVTELGPLPYRERLERVALERFRVAA